MTGRDDANRNGKARRAGRAPFDEARRRGLSRVAPITAGIVLAGGMVSVSTAVALAATRDTPAAGTGATTPAGAAATTPPVGGNGTGQGHNRSGTRRSGRTQAPSGGGLQPAGDSAPQGQSQGS